MITERIKTTAETLKKNYNLSDYQSLDLGIQIVQNNLDIPQVDNHCTGLKMQGLKSYEALQIAITNIIRSKEIANIRTKATYSSLMGTIRR